MPLTSGENAKRQSAAGQLEFATDDQLAARLRHTATGLTSFSELLGSAIRELNDVAHILDPHPGAEDDGS